MSPMDQLKHRWFQIPSTIRKPIVLVIGMAFVIISPFTGVLPGPGGIPIFLIGVAILATEFEWAKRLRDWTLLRVKQLGEWWRAHKVVGSLIIALCIAAVVLVSIAGYGYMRRVL